MKLEVNEKLTVIIHDNKIILHTDQKGFLTSIDNMSIYENSIYFLNSYNTIDLERMFKSKVHEDDKFRCVYITAHTRFILPKYKYGYLDSKFKDILEK